MSSYPILGRPTNPNRYSIEEIDEFELVDEDADDTSGFAVKSEPGWYVQVSPGDVKLLSAEQLRDFYRLGVINRQTYLCPSDTQQWLQLSAFVGDEAPPRTDDDKWQVLMGPGDVRVVSLDQLDDFYRLGVIDGQTRVWQTGMTEWVKLASLIGEESSQETEELWYATLAPGEVKQLTLEQLDDYYRFDLINERTLLWKAGMTQWLPLETVAGIAAPATVSAAPSSMTSMNAALSLAASVPPLAMSITPPIARSGTERWLVRFAVAAGLLLTLQRNDVLFSAAQTVKQHARYTELERHYLGGPLFGTLRNVEQLVSTTGGALPRVRLPWMVEAAHERRLHEVAAAELPAALPIVAQNAPGARLPPTATERIAPALSEPGKTEVQVTTPQSATRPPVAGTLSQASPQKKLTAVRSPSPAARKSPKKTAPVFRAKGDAYDPLNPTM